MLLLGLIKTNYLNNVLNLTSITLSVAIPNTLTKIKERLVLGSWMIFNIVFSTVYHEILYDQLLNLWDPLPKNFENLIENNYTLLVHPIHFDNFKNIPEIRRLNWILTEEHGIYCNNVVARSKEKLVSIISSPFVYYNFTKRYHDKIHIISKDWLPFQFAFYLTKNSFLTKPMDKFILDLKSFGIIQKMSEKSFGTYSIKQKALESNFVVLTLETLNGIFKMLLILHSTAVSVFLFEHFFRCMKNRNRK